MSEETSGPDLSETSVIEGGPLTYRLRLPRIKISPETPVPTLLMLHGRGANDGDIYELLSYIDPRILVAAPRAPLLAGDDPRGSYMWYENVQPGLPQPGSMEAAIEKVRAFIDQLEQSTGVMLDRHQLYIGGFSQGAAMSYGLVSTYPALFAGVIAHSSPFSSDLEQRLRQADLKQKPFFVAHGTNDFLAIKEHGQKAATCLREIGADLTYKEYPFAHETSPASRHDLADWLNARIRFAE